MNKFQINLSNLERQEELFTISYKYHQLLKKSGEGYNPINLSKINSIEELSSCIKSRELKIIDIEEGKKISQILDAYLDKEISLNKNIAKLNKEIENREKINNLKVDNSVKRENPEDYYIKVIDELKDSFNQDINKLEMENGFCNDKVK